MSSHINYDFLNSASKVLLIDLMKKKNWTSQTKTDLLKCETAYIRKKMQWCLEQYGTLQEIQQLQERIINEKNQANNKRQEKMQELKQKRTSIFQQGQEYFVVGKQIHVFDERLVHKYERTFRQFDPVPARVKEVKNDAKEVIVEFLTSRPWYEAGGHWVYKGEEMKFLFDPVTCTWLREGITPEVVRTIGSQGKSKYFELSYTRQYLILPTIPKSV